MFTRRVLNEPILVYRTSEGGLVAMQDRCCHRQAPLSRGRRESDCVRCGYHGLKFDAAGVCVEAPGLERIPVKARVRTYPVVSHNKWIFVWMGDPALADRALLPDNFSCDHPDWSYKPGYVHYDTPYLLVCDNLLDFSHLSYVHESTLGGSTAIAQAIPTIEQIPRGIRVTRHVPDVPPSPFWQSFQTFDRHVDRYFIYDFVLPGTLLMRSGGAPVGQAEGDLHGGVQLHSCQTLTPETETTTHYFFQQSHRSSIDDPAVTDTIYRGLVTAFEEDRETITAQHLNIDPAVPMLLLGMDQALVRYRRLVQQEFERERSAPSPVREAA
jgi:vanillate O-demethylase monooxygenase subunit